MKTFTIKMSRYWCLGLFILYSGIGLFAGLSQRVNQFAPLREDASFSLLLIFSLFTLFIIPGAIIYCLITRRFAIGVIGCGTIALSVLFVWCANVLWNRPLNPWTSYGVDSFWESVGAAKQLKAVYHLNHKGTRITGSAHAFGGYDWELRVEDINKDGLPDIVLQDGRFMDVLVFTPARDDKPPHFNHIHKE